MLRALSNFFVTFLNRWMPDSFVVAIILSLFTFVMAITVADFPVAAATQAWGDSIWDLLRFTNQIVLTLLLGHVLAHTPPVRNLLMAMAGRVASPYAAYVATTMVAFICTYISWGLGWWPEASWPGQSVSPAGATTSLFITRCWWPVRMPGLSFSIRA